MFMRAMIFSFGILLGVTTSFAQQHFTDSSSFAGIAAKKFTTALLPKCAQTGIEIKKGEKFLIAGIDSCLVNNVMTHQYLIRYEQRIYLADTAFVKTLHPGLFIKFQVVKDRTKALIYCTMIDFEMQNKNKETIYEQGVNVYFIRKEIKRINQEFNLLSKE